MSPYHAVGLRGFGEIQGHTIVHLREKFAEDTPDVEWIGSLASDGDWIVVSGDTRITRNPVNRRAWEESGLTGFFFGDAWSQANYWTKAAELVRWWPDITRAARENPRGTGFLIPKNAKTFQRLFSPR